MELTKRQKMLLMEAVKVLDDTSLNNILNYDGTEQDTCCLAEDIKIEFDLE